MIIPTEARATIAAYREGVSERKFIDDMWKRRRSEHRGRVKSSGVWPVKVDAAAKPSNVTAIRKRT